MKKIYIFILSRRAGLGKQLERKVIDSMAVKSLGSWFIEALTTDGAELPTAGDWLEYLLTGKSPPLTIKVDADISAKANDTQSARPLLSPDDTTIKTAPERINLMKKISQFTIDAVRQLTPETLQSHGVISKAKTGYVCLSCGNGSGKDGTGVIPKLEGGVYWYRCHCGASHDNIHLMAKFYGLDSQKDFGEIIKRACADFGIVPEYDGDNRNDSGAGTSGTTGNHDAEKERQQLEDEEKARREADMIHADIEKARLNLHNLPEAARRGLTFDTLEHFRCGFADEWQHPKSILEGKTPPKSRRLIIPSSDRHYLASAIDRDEVKKDFHKQHAGAKELFNTEAIDAIIAEKAINKLVVVEGEIDAMSIWQAFNGKLISVVAVGGVNKTGTGNKYLIDALKPRLDCSGGIKLPTGDFELEVVILYDDDDAGHGAAQKLRQELAALNIPAAEAYFPSTGDKKVDSNQILQDEGCLALKGAISRIVYGNDVKNALDKAKAEIAARRQQERERQATRENSSTGSSDFGKGGELTDDLRDKVFNKITGNSDLDNARRFVSAEGDRVRFLADGDRWLLYSGGVWKLAPAGKNFPLSPLIIDTADKLAAAARNKAEAKIAAPFRNQRNIGGMLFYVKGLVKVTRADLNKEKHLLNCLNCVVDLQTGKTYDHAPSLLMTQQVNGIYRAGYSNGRVEKFLRGIQPDADDRLALQVYFGYAITGAVNVEKFLFLQGGGGNGKGTLTGAILDLVDTYGAAFPIRGILKNKNADGNSATTALNTLIGKRLGISDEIPPNARVDLGALKHLTGGDNVPMRELFNEFDSVAPTWKLVFSGNDPLLIENVNDAGFLRRFLYLPFNQTFSGSSANLQLKQQLKSDDCRAGLLAWLVDGARWYYDHNCGIYISAGMKAAAKEYVNAQDWLGNFIREHCAFAEGAEIRRADFLKQLKEKCPDANKHSDTTLINMIRRIDGVEYARDNRSYKFVGIGWLDDDAEG